MFPYSYALLGLIIEIDFSFKKGFNDFGWLFS